MPSRVNFQNGGKLTANGAPLIQGPTAYTWRQEINYSSTVKTVKDFRGWRPPTAYHRDHVEWSSCKGVGIDTNGGVTTYLGQLSPSVFAMPIPSVPAYDAGLRSRSEVGALLKLKDQDVNYAQAFGERAQTARLVASSLEDVAAIMIGLRKGNLQKIKRGIRDLRYDLRMGKFGYGLRSLIHSDQSYLQKLCQELKPLDAVASKWLEIQYGWKPALSDVQGILQDLSERHNDPLQYIVTVKKSGKTYERAVRIENPNFWPSRVLTSTRQAAFVRLDYVPRDLSLIPFASLGLANVATVAWELTPLSFVFDWACPIGDWLNSLDAATGYTFKGGSLSQVVRVREKWASNGRKNGTGGTWLGSSHSFKFDRTVYGSSPFPMKPSFKNPVSSYHLANAAALLWVAFVGGKARVR